MFAPLKPSEMFSGVENTDLRKTLWNKAWDLLCLSSGGSRISRREGVDLVGGGVDSRGGYLSKILYVETKESGLLEGACAGHAPSRSANALLVVSNLVLMGSLLGPSSLFSSKQKSLKSNFLKSFLTLEVSYTIPILDN